MGRLTTIAALSSLFVLGSNAQGDICENVKGFYNYDAYGDFDFTGFFSNADNIGRKPSCFEAHSIPDILTHTSL
ncbi:uncharacterized protein CC84DRAFT_1161838 [Paraphaeosphaeria sporulosa]|uniref:Uncharacterized protein n=1 Tax=Paraphaeosphaeria sporulosa TaxID=1460663 RepID=A0A177CV23_9PLEO|nr:uncharacterized protein CC84DRAFT_1161838 [Paraphaeosphaeria sporulosa]OAG11061.1 hypothetical protein CC84DRAFT_1161838 [Paraphaeosphaeria sporulosa]